MQTVQYAQIVILCLCLIFTLQKQFKCFVQMAVSLVVRPQHGCNPLFAGSITAQFSLLQSFLTPVFNFFLIFRVAIENSSSVSIISEVSFRSRVVQGECEDFKNHLFCFRHLFSTGQRISHYRIIVSQALIS